MPIFYLLERIDTVFYEFLACKTKLRVFNDDFIRSNRLPNPSSTLRNLLCGPIADLLLAFSSANLMASESDGKNPRALER
jgi:hypothetical protein